MIQLIKGAENKCRLGEWKKMNPLFTVEIRVDSIVRLS